MKSYEYSINYELLWVYINQGHEIVGELIDLVPMFVKIRLIDGQFKIGTNGIGYEGFGGGKEDFIKVCKFWKLKFIIPTKIETK